MNYENINNSNLNGDQKLAQAPQLLTVEQAIAIAASHHQAGRTAEAEAMCLKVLHVEPRHPDALHMLGLIAYQTGRGI